MLDRLGCKLLAFALVMWGTTLALVERWTVSEARLPYVNPRSRGNGFVGSKSFRLPKTKNWFSGRPSGHASNRPRAYPP